jgi:hypothetical protein
MEYVQFLNRLYLYIYNIRTLSVNIKFICTSFRNRQNSEPLASFSVLFRSEYKWILYLTTMYVYCVYVDHAEDTLDNIYERRGMTLVSVLFCLNLTSFLTFLTLQDKHNIRTLSLNIKFICTRCETGLKSSPKARY